MIKTAANLMRDHVKKLAWVYDQISAAHGYASEAERFSSRHCRGRTTTKKE